MQRSAGDVVGMGMGFHGPQQLQDVLAQGCEVTFDLIVNRVDDQRITGVFVEKHIGVGAGRGVEQLNRLHGLLAIGLSRYALA